MRATRAPLAPTAEDGQNMEQKLPPAPSAAGSQTYHIGFFNCNKLSLIAFPANRAMHLFRCAFTASVGPAAQAGPHTPALHLSIHISHHQGYISIMCTTKGMKTATGVEQSRGCCHKERRPSCARRLVSERCACCGGWRSSASSDARRLVSALLLCAHGLTSPPPPPHNTARPPQDGAHAVRSWAGCPPPDRGLRGWVGGRVYWELLGRLPVRAGL